MPQTVQWSDIFRYVLILACYQVFLHALTYDARSRAEDLENIRAGFTEERALISLGVNPYQLFDSLDRGGGFAAVWDVQTEDTLVVWIQHCPAQNCELRPFAHQADLIITCYPESLPDSMRSKHAVPDGEGLVVIDKRFDSDTTWVRVSRANLR